MGYPFFNIGNRKMKCSYLFHLMGGLFIRDSFVIQRVESVTYLELQQGYLVNASWSGFILNSLLSIVN